MKIKKIISLMLVLILCFALCACKDEVHTSSADVNSVSSKTENNVSAKCNPLLYKVTDGKGNVVWLFGSIHVGREDYFPLPKYVTNAFNESDTLAVELDIVAFEKNIGDQMSAVSGLLYNDGTTIKDYISEELYNKSVKVLEEYNTYLTALDLYCPSFWSSMIESLMIEDLGGDVDLGIDRHLINMANKSKKEIDEIESADFQYGMLANFDDDIQVMLLESAVHSYENKEEAAADLKKMMDLWALGDQEKFAEYLNSSEGEMTDEEKQIYEKYSKAMFTDRNITMADYAEQALLGGKETFICVGAAHVVGEGAVADILGQKGYTVECIAE